MHKEWHIEYFPDCAYMNRLYLFMIWTLAYELHTKHYKIWRSLCAPVSINYRRDPNARPHGNRQEVSLRCLHRFMRKTVRWPQHLRALYPERWENPACNVESYDWEAFLIATLIIAVLSAAALVRNWPLLPAESITIIITRDGGKK